MARRPIALLFACGFTSLALIIAASLPIELSAASKATKKPIKNPKYDPTAEKVDLFDAVDAKQVTVKLVPKDALGGTVLIENKTDKPLTVKIPDAVAGVAINSQFGGMGGGGMGGMGGGGMGGGGFFSVPAEKVVSLQFNSVCLEHGKQEPGPSSKYTLVPITRVSSDPVLHELLAKVGTGKVDQQSAQAAAWHLTNKMSFQELAAKMEEHLGDLNPSPYFTREQLLGAQQLLSQAMVKAEEKAEEEKLTPKTETRVAPRTTSAKANPAASN